MVKPGNVLGVFWNCYSGIIVVSLCYNFINNSTNQQVANPPITETEEKVIKKNAALFLLFSIVLLLSFSQNAQPDTQSDGMSYRGPAKDESKKENQILGDRDFSGEGLYSGDVSFSLPITEIGAVNIALNYNSNIHKQVLADNRDQQAGWVGLGWSLEFGSITADINNTADVIDDRYFYSGPDGNSEMYLIENNKFRIKDYKYWDIERHLSEDGRIKGWTIIKEDGTTYRFGNLQNYSSFALNYDEYNTNDNYTNATRFYLGIGGLVSSPYDDEYGDLELIPYQWDLCNIEDVFDNKTYIYYYLETRPFYSTSNSSLRYTHASYPRKVVDAQTNRYVYFNNYVINHYSEYNDALYNVQRLYQTKCLYAISIKDQNHNILQYYDFNYDVDDILDISALQQKRYLTSILQKDAVGAGGNELDSLEFSYYGLDCDLGENPGALKTITYPSGGTVEYEYQNLALNTVDLDTTIALSFTPNVTVDLPFDVYKFRCGLSGSDFVIALEYDAIPGAIRNMEFYRWGAKGWYKDTDNILPNNANKYWVCGDYVVIKNPGGGIGTGNEIRVIKRKDDSWENFNIDSTICEMEGKNLGPGDFFEVIGMTNDFFVVKYSGEVFNNHYYYVVTWNERKWEIFPLDQESNINCVAHCGKRFFVLSRFNGSTNYFVTYNWNGSSWVQTEDGSVGTGENYNLCVGDDYWAIWSQSDSNRVHIFQWDGSSWDDSVIFANDNSSTTYVVQGGMYAGDRFFVTVSQTYRSGTASPSKIFVYIKQANDWERYQLSASPGESDFYFAKVAIKKDDIFIGYRNGEFNQSPKGILLKCKVGASGVTPVKIDEFTDLQQYEYATVTPTLAGNGNLFAQWDGTVYSTDKTKMKSYITRGDSIIAGTLLDASNANSLFVQPGSDFLATISSNGNYLKIYKQGHNNITRKFNITYSGAPGDFPVFKKRYDSGMGNTNSLKFIFNKGTYDAGITTAKYNQAIVTSPADSSYGITVTNYYNDLGVSDIVDTTGFDSNIDYEELDGMVYSSMTYKAPAPVLDSLVTKSVSKYAIQIIDTTENVLHRRSIRSSETLQGITTSTDYKYNDTNGMVRRTIETNSDTTRRVTETTFAFEKYSAMQDVNMISQVAQQTVYAFPNGLAIPDSITGQQDSLARSSSVTTYKEWWGDDWAPERFYSWKYQGEDYHLPTFLAWQSDQTASSDWLLSSKILSRNGRGAVYEQQDANEVVSTTKWSHNQSLPIATFVNAEKDEILIDDFSDGIIDDREPVFWDKQGSFWSIIDGALTWERPNYIGMVYKSGTFEAQYSFIAEYDIKINAAYSSEDWGAFHFRKEGFNDDPWDSGYVVLTREDGIVELCDKANSVTLDSCALIEHSFNWHHIKIQVENTQIQVFVDGELGIEVTDTQYDSSNHYLGFYTYRCNVQFDNLRIYPLDALCTSQAYDPGTFLMTEQIDENGIRQIYEYDSFHRLTRTVAANSRKIISENNYYYSRAGNNDNFNSTDPNYTVTATFPDGISTDGLLGYWRFDDIEKDSAYNSISNTLNGSIINAARCHGVIGEAFSFEGDTAYISIEHDSELEDLTGLTIMAWVYPNSDIGDCDIILCKEDEYEMAWSNFDSSLTSAVKTNAATWQWTEGTGERTVLPEKWTFVAITWDGSFISEYVNGELKNTHPQPGTLIWKTSFDIRIGGRKDDYPNARWHGKIDEVKLYKRALTDEEIWAHYNSNISIAFTDGLGRPIQVKNKMDNGFIVSRTEYNSIGEVYKEYKPQKITADSSHYITSEIFNSDTCETFIYWNDPLKRIKYQIHPDNTNIYYTYGASPELNAINSHFERIRDENSHFSAAFTDKFGNKIGGYNAHSSNEQIKWMQQYDALGNMIVNQPPNHWTDGAVDPGQWDSEIKYNTLGQVYEKITPEDTVKYIYDLNGNLRYSQTAAQAANGNNFTVYYYDEFNRLTKVGEEIDQDWSWSLDLTNSLWGGGANEWKIKYVYDKNGVWGKANFCQNRLTRVAVNTDTTGYFALSPEIETLFVYDEFGNIIEKRITIDRGETLSEKVIQYEYDLMGNEKKIIYPSGNIILKKYNQQGQIKKISAVK